MKKLIYSVSILFLLSSCSNGGSSGPSAPAKPLKEQLADAQSATDYSAKITPEKFTVIKANLSYDEQKEKYAVGCKKAGEPSWEETQIDPKLLVGHTFVDKQGRSALLETDTFDTQEKRIASVDGNRVVTEINFLEGSFGDSVFSSIDQIFSAKPHITLTVTYAQDANGKPQFETDYKGNYTPAALEYLQTRNGVQQYLSCSVSYEASSPYVHSTDKVSYQFDGHNVVAYVDKSSNSGEVKCSQRTAGTDKETESISLGHGTTEHIVITSNELIHQGLLGCGGVELYRMDKIVLDSGKVIKADVTKKSSGPLR